MTTLEGTFWRDFGNSLNVVDMGECNRSGLDVENGRPVARGKSN
jgi:hypothetical protein